MKIFLCLLAGILCLFSSVHADDIYFQEFRAYDLELVYNSGNLRFDFSLVCPDTVGVMMEVRNFSSEVVRSYDIGAFREGSNFIDWDCKDEFGSLLPPGTYTCELKVITFKSPKKLPGSFSYYNSLKRPSPPPFYPDNLPVAQRKWINNSGYNFLCPNCGKCYPEVTAKRLKIRCDGEKDKEKCNFYFATKKQLAGLLF